MDAVVDVLTGQAFIQAVAVIIVTAIVTGVVVPIVKGNMDDRKARQDKIIEAQSRFLDKISKILWSLRYRAMAVAYYKSIDQNKYDEAARQYDEKVWDLFNEYRSEISKARRLMSEEVYEELLDFYRWLVTFDNRVSGLIQGSASAEAWRELQGYIYRDATNKIDNRIATLASDLQLEIKQRRPRLRSRRSSSSHE